MELQQESKREGREARAVLSHSLQPSHRNRTMELFCARATNHKQSLIINSPCSFGVPGSTACDTAAADTTDRNRRANQCYACDFIYLSHNFGLLTAQFLSIRAPYHSDKYLSAVRTYLNKWESCWIQRSLQSERNNVSNPKTKVKASKVEEPINRHAVLFDKRFDLLKINNFFKPMLICTYKDYFCCDR